MNQDLTLCSECGVLIAKDYLYTHQGNHQMNNVVPYECHTCAAHVAPSNYEHHIKYHDRQRKVEELLNRLLGDVEAHLDHLQREEEWEKVVRS